MSGRSDGGPAFPQKLVTGFETRGGESAIRVKTEWIAGMTLRDYFASVLLPNRDVITFVQQGNDENAVASAIEHAKAAYLLADAMLMERNR